MANWYRQRIDPMEYLKNVHGIVPPHITYDPKMRKGDYNVIRQSAHDGTFAFTYELLDIALKPIVEKRAYYKARTDEYMAAKDVRYVLGPLRLSTVTGTVDLPCGRYPGERQRTRMPVKVIEIQDGPNGFFGVREDPRTAPSAGAATNGDAEHG